jgi:acyl-CoA dehydrogenase
LEQLLILE